MLRYFSVKNFRQFREELIFDFSRTRDYQFSKMCVKDGLVNKAIIYGKNGIGKTNLGTAMGDIYGTTRGLPVFKNDPCYRNADMEKDETIQFHYVFDIDGTSIDYQYEKTDFSHVVAEKLSFDGEMILEYNRMTNHFDFSNTARIGAEQLQWDAFENMSNEDDDAGMEASLTALKYVSSNTPSSEETVFNKLIRFIRGMRFSASQTVAMIGLDRSLSMLADSGEEAVKKLENFLNEFGVPCKLTIRQDADEKNNIYFDYKTPLKFSNNISSGTRLLTRFYLQFVNTRLPISFIFIDEFDAFYHFELSEKIVKMLETEFDCQVVLTTHNTNLLSNTIMRPDCFMILHDGKLTPICDATRCELRQGHNLEKLYINGEFDE